MKVVFKMPFLSLSNADLELGARKFTWSFYTIDETLSIVKKVELINQLEFVEAAFTENSNTFLVYIATLRVLELVMSVHHLQVLLMA